MAGKNVIYLWPHGARRREVIMLLSYINFWG